MIVSAVSDACQPALCLVPCLAVEDPLYTQPRSYESETYRNTLPYQSILR